MFAPTQVTQSILPTCPIDVDKVTLQSQIEHHVCPDTGSSEYIACLSYQRGQSHAVVTTQVSQGILHACPVNVVNHCSRQFFSQGHGSGNL